MISRMSTSTSGSAIPFAPTCGSSLELIRDLYQKLEPQITKSYRPHVTYVPPAESPREKKKSADKESHAKGGKLKVARIALGAIAELTKRKDTKKRLLEASKREAVSNAQDLEKVTKDVNRSLPNLPGTNS
ncbi:hypothetical protein DPMN_082979 [Dreissena polymorpha]|uniref:Uncharacterized protein n=1 Tax=Dreissena polymorpha TaxID=45954 RepID=A0A9D3YBK5_DREPO|nr:hypothetical protein DPMN_082979 [Dreissena polymorpha]